MQRSEPAHMHKYAGPTIRESAVHCTTDIVTSIRTLYQPKLRDGGPGKRVVQARRNAGARSRPESYPSLDIT